MNVLPMESRAKSAKCNLARLDAIPDAVTSQAKPEPRLRLVHPSASPIRARASRGLPSVGSPR